MSVRDRLSRPADPVVTGRRERPFLVGVATTALVVVTLVVTLGVALRVLGVPSFRDDAVVVHAEFASAGDIDPGSPVRVHGVDVGFVESVGLSSSHAAVIAMRLEEPVDLRADAAAAIHCRLLLCGTAYVELVPGTRRAPLSAGGSIPRERTAAQVSPDDLLAPYTPRTRHRTRWAVRGMKEGLRSSSSVRRLVRTLRPTLATVTDGVEPLRGEETGDLRRLVASTARATSAVSANPRSLRRAITSLDAVLGVTASRSRELQATLDALPATLTEATRALSGLDVTLPGLDRLATTLRPGGRRLGGTLSRATPTLRAARDLLRDAAPLLRTLRPAFAELDGASRAGTPLLRALAPTVRRLDEEIVPILAKEDPATGLDTAELVGPTASVLGSAASQFDRNGYYLRFPTLPNERSAGAAPCQLFIADPTAAETVRCKALLQLFPFTP
jgi:phospholipid/cholesterol/gamma-HCH transport system substrate-binding protein